LLRASGLADAEEAGGMGRVLTAAALTYVVGLLRKVGVFLVLIVVAEAPRRMAT
jgi:Zn-dependent membrane protease YugP